MDAQDEYDRDIRNKALEKAAEIAEAEGQSFDQDGGEIYIARKIADAIRKLKS